MDTSVVLGGVSGCYKNLYKHCSSPSSRSLYSSALSLPFSLYCNLAPSTLPNPHNRQDKTSSGTTQWHSVLPPLCRLQSQDKPGPHSVGTTLLQIELTRCPFLHVRGVCFTVHHIVLSERATTLCIAFVSLGYLYWTISHQSVLRGGPIPQSSSLSYCSPNYLPCNGAHWYKCTVCTLIRVLRCLVTVIKHG